MTNLQIALISKISFRLLANEKAVIISWLRWVIKWNLIFLKPAIMPYLYLISKQWKLSLVDTFRTLKRCLTAAELAAYRNVKIQSLYGSWEKWGFVKVAITRAVPFRERPFGELPLHVVCSFFLFLFWSKKQISPLSFVKQNNQGWGVLNKALYKEAPPLGLTLTLLYTIFDRKGTLSYTCIRQMIYLRTFRSFNLL